MSDAMPSTSHPIEGDDSEAAVAMPPLRLLPVLAGLVASWLCRLPLVWLLISVVTRFWVSRTTLSVSESPVDDVAADYLRLIHSPGVELAQVGVVAVATLIGGYVAGRLGRPAETKHAVAMGCAALAVAVLASMVGIGRSASDGITFLGFLVLVPAAIAGGHLARRSD